MVWWLVLEWTRHQLGTCLNVIGEREKKGERRERGGKEIPLESGSSATVWYHSVNTFISWHLDEYVV